MTSASWRLTHTLKQPCHQGQAHSLCLLIQAPSTPRLMLSWDGLLSGTGLRNQLPCQPAATLRLAHGLTHVPELTPYQTERVYSTHPA